MEKINEAVWIDYTDNPEEEGIYFNSHNISRKIINREPEIIHVKLNK